MNFFSFLICQFKGHKPNYTSTPTLVKDTEERGHWDVTCSRCKKKYIIPFTTEALRIWMKFNSKETTGKNPVKKNVCEFC